ncbi:SDR family NAD(P)-dependent oxidoreductase [Nocardia miyunensis]|uniref:SDR family NAD(P)-dependent oxidoreductase n=1 Tax=Nocardia miyunensis TaxID=282684 RepID=UPI000AB58A89|nr:SDR family NAD(P)-dependent oxidoreductase [Nocardia miyunensis]
MPESIPHPTSHPARPRVIVVSGGTDGMGRALALARLERGDTVIVLGSSPAKGQRLLADAGKIGATDRIDLIQVDLSSVARARAAIRDIAARHERIDALTLFANRQAPKRTVTGEGLEQTFTLYYLSRYLLSHGLSPQLGRSQSGVIVNVAGVGMTKGQIHWDDLQLEHGYGMVTAQLQAGRANDLLGVAFAAQPHNPIRYVLYHPGFTKSGDLSPLPAAMRASIRAAARLSARPIAESIASIHEFIDTPPAAPLTAIDRDKPVPLTIETLDPANAERLSEATRTLLAFIEREHEPG